MKLTTSDDAWRTLLLETPEARAELLAAARRVAVIGIKPASAGGPAHDVPAYLQRAGYDIVPVPVYYPDVATILDVPVHRSLATIEPPADLVILFRRPEDVPKHLDELLADRRLGALRLRRLAPGVLISPSPVTTVLSLLRTHGYAPVAEDREGGVVLTPRHHRRSPGRHRPGGYAARTGYAVPAGSRRRSAADGDDTGEAFRLAAELIAAEERREAALAAWAEGLDDDVPETDPVLTLAILRDAAAQRRAVRIGVSDAAGRVRPVDLVPERVSGGRLDAVATGHGARLTFSLSRVTGARPS